LYLPVLSNVSFGLPLLIVIGAGLVWWWVSRVSSPPYLVATPPYHSWRINPVSAAYASLRQDQYLLASFLLRERVAAIAQARFGVSPENLRAWAAGRDVPDLSLSLTLHRVLNDLASAYQSAYLAEGMPPWNPFSQLTLGMRRRRAARDFDRAARDVEQVVAAWGSAA
jgi:hypothetical protein